MYANGTILDFESRLHQLPTSQNDLNSFITEGTTYLTIAYFYQIQKWNNEFAKRGITLLQSNVYYITPALSTSGTNGMIGLDSSVIYGLDGSPIVGLS